MADEQITTAKPAPSWRYYVIAFLLVAVTLMIRIGVTPWDGGQPLLVVFLVPVVISAYLGGLGPGVWGASAGTAPASGAPRRARPRRLGRLGGLGPGVWGASGETPA